MLDRNLIFGGIYMFRRSKANKLSKVGVTKTQIKSQGSVVDELKKKLARSNDNNVFETRDTERQLNRIRDKLERISNSMGTTLRNLKSKISGHYDDDEIIKNAKSILHNYHQDYANLTADAMSKFKGISTRFEVTPTERFDSTKFKAAFDAIQNVANKECVEKGELKELFRGIAEYTGQGAGVRPAGFKDPYMSFFQLMSKLPNLLGELIEAISGGETGDVEKMKNSVRNIKKEIKSTAFKKFPIVNYSKLDDKKYRRVQENTEKFQCCSGKDYRRS